jgi:acetyl esterase/lipase
VSIDYSKSPQNKFPTAYEDAIAQTLAIIDDKDLPIDRSRVVLCGSSAGGNLLLAVVQDSRLRSKVTGIATIYPAVDLAENGAAKMARRPDATIPDFIGDSYADILRLYLDLDAEQPTSLKDVRVSPAYFAEREAFPAHFFAIGAEHDMFCYEAQAMADRLADMAGGGKDETETGWKAGAVQWSKIMGQPHAFDNFPAKAPVTEASRLAAVDAMYSLLSEWLADVFDTEALK